jgi:hypothetical protein
MNIEELIAQEMLEKKGDYQERVKNLNNQKV